MEVSDEQNVVRCVLNFARSGFRNDYNSYQIKNMNLWLRYQGIVLLVLIKQCR